MREDIKKSLDTIFKHEQLTNLQRQPKGPKKRWIPIVVTACTIALTAILVLPFIKTDITTQTTNRLANPGVTMSDIATLDHLYGEYIGNNSAVGEIKSYVFSDYGRTTIQLHTTAEPYGVTVFANEEIPQHIQLKFANYLFSLIPNASFTQVETNNSQQTYNRETLEQNYNVDFSSAINNDEILTNYYTMLFQQIPQLQTTREDAKTFVFKALQSEEILSDFTKDEKPDYAFTLDAKHYLLWNEDDFFYMTDISKPTQALIVKGEPFLALHQFVTTDYKVVKGLVEESNESEIFVKATDYNVDMSFWVAVDDPTAYEIGNSVTIWMDRHNFSLQAYVTAAKVLKH